MMFYLALIALTFGALAAPVLPFNFTPIWNDALDDARVKHATIARLMGISSQQLSQQVAGQGHLSFFRLLCVATDDDGRRFFQALMERLGPRVGLEDLAIQQQLSVMRSQIDDLLRAMKARQVTAWLDDFPKKETA